MIHKNSKQSLLDPSIERLSALKVNLACVVRSPPWWGFHLLGKCGVLAPIEQRIVDQDSDFHMSDFWSQVLFSCIRHFAGEVGWTLSQSAPMLCAVHGNHVVAISRHLVIYVSLPHRLHQILCPRTLFISNNITVERIIANGWNSKHSLFPLGSCTVRN